MLRWVGLFLVVSAMLATCVSAAETAPYEINTIVSLTGPAAFVGASHQKILSIVEDIVNRKGGINGRPVHFAINDDQSNPTLAVQLVNKFAAQKVPLIFGPGFVATCSAAMPITVKDGPLMWCLAPGIYPPASSFVLSTQATTDDTVLVLVRYLRERGWTRLAVISSTDASGQAFDRGVRYAMAHSENADVHIVAYEHMNPTDISANAQASNVKAANPQAVLTLATGTPWGTIMRSLADVGLDVPVGGGNGNMVVSQLDQYRAFLPRQLYFPGNIAIAPHTVGNGPVADQQAQFYRALQTSGIKLDATYTIAWDPAFLVVSALRKLGTNATADQLRDYVVHLHGWTGILGIYDFRDGGQRGIGPGAMAIDQWEKDRSTFVAVSRPGGYLK